MWLLKRRCLTLLEFHELQKWSTLVVQQRYRVEHLTSQSSFGWVQTPAAQTLEPTTDKFHFDQSTKIYKTAHVCFNWTNIKHQPTKAATNNYFHYWLNCSLFSSLVYKISKNSKRCPLWLLKAQDDVFKLLVVLEANLRQFP